VRPAVFLVLAACSPSREDVPKPQLRTESRHSIDIAPFDSAPFTVRGVEIARGPKHSLELGYRIEAPDTSLLVPAEFTCRVQGFNLVYPTPATGKSVGPRLTALWRPDPFDEDPELCQIDWLLRDAGYASACYRGGELVSGGCPPGSFPKRTEDELKTNLAGAFAIDIVHAAFSTHDDALTMSGIFTNLAPYPEKHRLVAQASCGEISGEAGMPLLPMERLAVGSSVFGSATILLDRPPAAGAHCVFRIVSRAAEGPPSEQELAKYCVTAGSPTVTTCPL
jgi:hypothetical protein